MRTFLLSLFLLASLIASAQTALPTKRITLFKNSTAMIVKEGTANVKNDEVLLPIPDQTLNGTFFIGSTKDNILRSVVLKDDTLKKKTKCETVAQFLAGNIGKHATIYYNPFSPAIQGSDKTLSGMVTEYKPGNSVMKFQTDAGKIMVMPVAQVYQAEFGQDPSPSYETDSIKRMVVIQPDKATASMQLQEVYMTKGFNWIPSYYLKIKDGKTARLEMKATLENYAEDLNDAEAEIVVGAPQMNSSGTLDPITYNYITSVAASTGYSNVYQPRGYDKNNYYQSNAAGSYGDAGAAPPSVSSDADYSTDGEKVGDLYVYKLGKITLPNKSKGLFPIFSGNVDYKDKYEASIGDWASYASAHYLSAEEKTYDVFHSLELTNTTGVPLTTASVMVVNEKDQFMAQDELKYTPVGSNTFIRLSKAIDIVLKNNEEEKNREDNAKKIAKQSYSRVTLKGTINLTNYQKKDVTVCITKSVNGSVLSQSDGGKNTTGKSNKYMNPASEIKWEVSLGANDKKTLTYEYEVYFIP